MFLVCYAFICIVYLWSYIKLHTTKSTDYISVVLMSFASFVVLTVFMMINKQVDAWYVCLMTILLFFNALNILNNSAEAYEQNEDQLK